MAPPGSTAAGRRSSACTPSPSGRQPAGSSAAGRPSERGDAPPRSPVWGSHGESGPRGEAGWSERGGEREGEGGEGCVEGREREGEREGEREREEKHTSVLLLMSEEFLVS